MEESQYYKRLWAQEASNYIAGALNTFYQLYMAGIHVTEIYVHISLLSPYFCILLLYTAMFPGDDGDIKIIFLVTSTSIRVTLYSEYHDCYS